MSDHLRMVRVAFPISVHIGNILPFSSGHSYKIKESITMGALSTSMQKSCACITKTSLDEQISRLKASDYPTELIENTKWKLLRPPRTTEEDPEEIKTVAIPHVHGYTHRMGKAAIKHDIRVVGTYKNKISRLPNMIEKMMKEKTIKCK